MIISDQLQKRISEFMGFWVLVGSLVIVGALSYDILSGGEYNPDSTLTLKIQLYVCAIFILDFAVRFAISSHKLKFIRNNFMLLLFSIPFLNIVYYMGWTVPAHIHYLLGLVPLLRGGFGMIMIINWLSSRTATSLMISYLSVLASLVYFSSLLFFVAERGLNPEVHSYWDSLWWAAMDMDTVGSNVIAVTPIGKVLSVILACAGMMMLPVFTVWVTDRIARTREKNKK